MNKYKIFELFENNDQTEEDKKSINDFKEHPLFKIEIFKKIIKNYILHGDELLKFFEKSNIDLDVKDIKKAGEYMLYNRAFDNIDFIDLNNDFHLDIIKKKSDNEIIDLIDNCIFYFEKFEEFEKCNKLIKIKRKIEDFLKINLAV